MREGDFKIFHFFIFCGVGWGLESVHGVHGESMGDFKEKRKYFNICTVACRLKNFIFLLN